MTEICRMKSGKENGNTGWLHTAPHHTGIEGFHWKDQLKTNQRSYCTHNFVKMDKFSRYYAMMKVLEVNVGLRKAENNLLKKKA